MIHTIRKLARQIHRRSLWQVVGVYGLLAWALVVAVSRLTIWLGLPSWTLSMTILLVVALFPLVVATAAVQEGVPGLRIQDVVDPNELPGLTPEQVHVVPEAHPLYGLSVFTWRNTLLGAVTAVAVLLTSVVAYLTMWALGIGPVGSLLAQGVIAEREPVAVATFANLTDDASLGALVADAMEIDLMESGLVTVLADDEPLANATVVISGDVARTEGGYVMSASIILVQRGVLLARFEEETSEDTDLLGAVELLSERVREKLGESLRSVRSGRRLGSLKTEEAEAQRFFGLGSRAVTLGDPRSAAQLLEDALRIDEEFAVAWRALGAVREQLADTAGAVDAYRRVVELWPQGDGRGRTVEELRTRIAALDG